MSMCKFVKVIKFVNNLMGRFVNGNWLENLFFYWLIFLISLCINFFYIVNVWEIISLC